MCFLVKSTSLPELGGFESARHWNASKVFPTICFKNWTTSCLSSGKVERVHGTAILIWICQIIALIGPVLFSTVKLNAQDMLQNILHWGWIGLDWVHYKYALSQIRWCNAVVVTCGNMHEGTKWSFCKTILSSVRATQDSFKIGNDSDWNPFFWVLLWCGFREELIFVFFVFFMDMIVPSIPVCFLVFCFFFFNYWVFPSVPYIVPQ